jgi:tRNA dimethylallyltransferase
MNAPLVVVCGPTGSGKSGLAIAVARHCAVVQKCAAEVINCDSLQVYRQFDIGTAKLPESERGGIPHHLIDVAEPAKGFTAGDFSARGRQVLTEITGRGALPIVAGGTGFYLRALIDGLSPGPLRDEELRQRLSLREQRRPGGLHRILRRLDPASARRIHARDVPKLIRALEICLRSSHNPSGQPERDRLTGYRILKIGLFPRRELLYEVLDRRCEAMFRDGLLGEIEAILAGGVARDAKPFQALGYKEGLACVEGRITRPEALALMQRDTRRYAKRQVTWFRSEAEIVPFAGFGGDPDVRSAVLDRVDAFLA